MKDPVFFFLYWKKRIALALSLREKIWLSFGAGIIFANLWDVFTGLVL
jgi:hypothetical protein